MKTIKIFFTIILLLTVAACGSDNNSEKSNESGNNEPEEVPSEITIGAATTGGLWYTLAGAMEDEMGDIFPDSSTAIVEGGSTANLLGIGKGEFDIGFTNGEAISEAKEGTGEFDEVIDNFSTVATMYPNPVQLVVREDSDIESVEDLKGKTVSPGIKGYSGEIAFQRILDIKDMSYDDLDGIEYIGTEDAAELLRDDHIDAWIGTLDAPSATWQELDTTVGIRVVSLDEEMIDGLHEDNEGYAPYTIEEGTYPNQEKDVETVAPPTVLLVNDDTMPEDAVYDLTEMVVENSDKWASVSSTLEGFDAEYSVENNVGDMNPGAEKYYEEIDALD